MSPEPKVSKVLWTIRNAKPYHCVTEAIQADTASTDP